MPYLKADDSRAIAIHEEYQSTNEELLTSKEELQSLNEELTALNGQLQETLQQQKSSVSGVCWAKGSTFGESSATPILGSRQSKERAYRRGMLVGGVVSERKLSSSIKERGASGS